MIPIETAFVGLIILFGIIGALRGWAKELLVLFSVILARFAEFVMWTYMPVINVALQNLDVTTWFYSRVLLFIMVVAFGYATTAISKSLSSRARKDKLEDTLLGFFLGAINGFFVVGMMWGFLEQLGYNLWGITAPQTTTAISIIEYLPITWLEGPALFVAVTLSFAFVLIVFV